MRTKELQNLEHTVLCDCCGSWEYDVFTVAHKFNVSPEVKERVEIAMCETCTEDCEFDLEITLTSGLVADPDLWAKVQHWARVHLILAFTPATEQLNDLDDVREWFDALTALLVWHPDNDFAEYETQDKAKIFSEHEAAELDKAMVRARELCHRENARPVVDVYDLGLEAMQKAGRAPKEMNPDFQAATENQPDPLAKDKLIAELLAALKGAVAQLTGPVMVHGDGIGNDGTKTGLSGEEFNALQESRLEAARSAILKAEEAK